MKPFKASLENTIWRFYLLMAIVIGAFFAGVPVLAVLALPVFISAMLGISFWPKKDRLLKEKTNHRVIRVNNKHAA